MKRLVSALLASMIIAQPALAQPGDGFQRFAPTLASSVEPSWPSGSWQDRYCRGEIDFMSDPGIKCPSGASIPARYRAAAACLPIQEAIDRNGAAGFFNLANDHRELVIACMNTPELRVW